MFSQHSLRRSAPCSTPAGSSNTSMLSGEGKVTTGNQTTDLLKKKSTNSRHIRTAQELTDTREGVCNAPASSMDAVMPCPAKGEGRAQRPR